MKLISVLLPVLLFMSAFNEPISNDQATDYAFSDAGELWLATSYCHLSIPLSLKSLKRKIEVLQDAVKTLMDAHKNSGSKIEKSIVLKAQEDLFFCQRAYDDLENFLKSPSQDQMQKRFLGALAGGLIAGTLFGLFNSAKIASLQSSLNNLEQARINMVHITERVVNETAINAQHILALEEMTLDIANQVRENALVVDMSIVMVQIQRMKAYILDEISMFNKVLDKIALHRLAIGFVSSEQNVAAIKELATMAEKKQYYLAISAPQHIYQLEVSLFFGDENTEPSLMVHVPLVRNKQGMKLLKFKSFPVKDPVHNYEISITPNHEYLALTPNQEYFTTMTASEVQLCHRVHHHLICPNLQIVWETAKTPSCLVALYFSKGDLVHELCDITIKKSTNFITALNNNEFLIHSHKPVTATEYCYHDQLTKSRSFQLSELEKLRVNDGCYLKLPNAKLYSIAQIETDVKMETYKWALKFENLIRGLDSKNINELVSSFQENNQKLPPLDPFLAKALHNDLMAAAKPGLTSHWSIQTSVGASLAALLIGSILLLVVVGAGIYKRKRTQRLRQEEAARQNHLRMGYVDHLMVERPLLPEVQAIPPK